MPIRIMNKNSAQDKLIHPRKNNTRKFASFAAGAVMSVTMPQK
jgi:hypothetical protein